MYPAMTALNAIKTQMYQAMTYPPEHLKTRVAQAPRRGAADHEINARADLDPDPALRFF